MLYMVTLIFAYIINIQCHKNVLRKSKFKQSIKATVSKKGKEK